LRSGERLAVDEVRTSTLALSAMCLISGGKALYQPPLYVLQLSYVRRRRRRACWTWLVPFVLSTALWTLIIWGTAWLVLVTR
jgi:hypothetical protein